MMGELYSVCSPFGKNYEIIFVDDGSADRTPDILAELASKDSRIKVLRFSRNFGHQAAFSAGMDTARGELVMTMDGDLQHPPRLIPEFIKHAENGSDIVIGERLFNRQNSFVREMTGRTFYRFMSAVTNLEFKNVSDFAMYKRSVINVLKRLPEKERFLRGMVQWIGFNKKYIPYIVEARKHGQPKYTAKKLLGLIMSGLTSFSAFPLRLAFWVGMMVFAISIGFAAYVFIDHYLNPNPLIAGWATLVILVLGLGSVQLMVMGVVGEYLYKMFNEIKGRPLYIVAETKNIDKNKIEQSQYGIHNI
nr:hypothetical protein [uncultured bacterium]